MAPGGRLGPGAAPAASLLQLYLAEALYAAGRDSLDAFVSKPAEKLSADKYQRGRTNRGLEGVLPRLSHRHVMLTGRRCGPGSSARP